MLTKISGVAIFFTLFLWGERYIVVDLTKQRAYAIEDDRVLFSGKVSTGKRGYETPTGVYRILEKKRKHVSNLYPKPNGGAKMPYMMRLTWSGIAMHQGYTPNYRASHGCIRLKRGFARRLYRWAKVGMRVVVKEGKKRKRAYGVDNIRFKKALDSLKYKREKISYKKRLRKVKKRSISVDYEVIDI
ncbi:MAG: L,D-transpeptidase family protein [Epsilonproteobacteria bacterium]|nr:L,D-transpeptidase family protein [Campylobacterota bacterium]